MKTGKFLQLLENNTGKELVFEYKEDTFVPKAYHITEIKNQHVDSVDCGGVAHSYDETVVQLWVSGNETKEKNMEAEKALKIFNIVDAKIPMKRDTPIFFEWGFGQLKTSVYKVEAIEESDDKVVVKMFVPPTVCKPRELEVVETGTATSCCEPGGKCC